VEPAIQTKLTNCQTTAPRELTPDEIKKKYGKKAYENYLKQEAQLNAAGKHAMYMDQDEDIYGDRCGALLETLVTGSGEIDGTGYNCSNPYQRKAFDKLMQSMQPTPMCETEVFPRSFTFHRGRLVMLGIHLADSYEFILEDVTNRLGVSPTETRIPYQNAFGAKWDAATSIWTTDKLTAHLSHDNNPAKPTPSWFTVSDLQWREEQRANAPSRPNPLD
jgi:hypothetical protein